MRVVSTSSITNLHIGFVALASAAIFPSSPSHAAAPQTGTIPAGIYGCMTDIGGYLTAMGTIEIRGSTYRYILVGGRPGRFFPYSIGADGQISWRGPMGALNTAPSVIKTSYMENRPTYRSIIIKYNPKPDSYSFTIGCRKDLKGAH